MNRKTALAGLVGCILLTAPVGASTSPLASSTDAPDTSSDASAEVPDAALEATAAQFSADPVVVPTAPTARDWAGSGEAVVAPEQVPTVVLDAYTTAVSLAPQSCNITVPLLAAIGQVESGNLVGRQLDAGHKVTPAMVGPRLDGGAFKAIGDTDGGALDGDTEFDRAVGPMQFLPSTWSAVAVDIDGDGQRDPQDIYDAAGAAMVYLCGDRDLADPEQLRRAVLTYNRSTAYLQQVLQWKATFEQDGLAAIASLPIFSATSLGSTGTADLLAASPATAQPVGKKKDKGKAKKPAAPANTPGAVTVTPTPAPAPAPSAGPSPSDRPSDQPSDGTSPSDGSSPSDGTSPSTPADPSSSPSENPSPAYVSQTTDLPATCPESGAIEIEQSFFNKLVFADAEKTIAKHIDGGRFPDGDGTAPVAKLCQVQGGQSPAPSEEPSDS